MKLWKHFLSPKSKPLAPEEVTARFYRAVTLYGIVFGPQKLAAVLGEAALALFEDDSDLTFLLESARTIIHQE